MGCERDLQAALEREPEHIDAIYNLAVLRQGQGRPTEAMRLYDRVLRARPDHFAACLNRAALRMEANDFQGALLDLDSIARRGDAPAHVHVSRARALFALFRDADALEAAEAALRLDPMNERAALDKGIALASLGLLEKAEPALARSKAHGNPRLTPLAIRISRLALRQSVCDWSSRDQLVAMLRRCGEDERIARAINDPGLLFSALSLPLSSEDLAAVAELALRGVREDGAKIAAGAPSIREAKDARIRVAFFAASLRAHPESFLIRRLLSGRDRERFEYWLYALNPDDGSDLRSEIARSVDHFVDASSWNGAAIVKRARGDRLDIGIDLSGTFFHAKPEIFAARVAPVQAAYLAVASTMGSGIHDYRLSDPVSTPVSEQANWPEKLVLLPTPPWCYDDSLTCSAAGLRVDHGLPEQGFVFTCMNQAVKVEPDAFAVWMRLLAAVPGSVLWLLDPGPIGRANLLRESASRGIADERLVFAPRVPLAQHLGRLAHADLFLDTFYCNAHTTALDALWAAVPVLTLEGRTMASRLAGAFLRSGGLEQLAVPSVKEYESMALILARDPQRMHTLRAAVQSSRGRRLFDTKAQVRSVERAIEAMVWRHRDGLPPDTLIVSE